MSVGSQLHNTRALRILMLEDSPEDAELIVYELRRGGIGFETVRVATQEEFRRALEEYKPDLILADYRLPGFDGLTALRIVRAVSHEIPFIFVTGAMGEEVAIESLRSGATDYVLKDRLSKLVPAVKRAVKEARELAQRRRAEEQLRQAAAAFENTREAILMLDRKRRVTMVNRAYTMLTGYLPEEALGRPLERLHCNAGNEVLYRELWERLDSTGSWWGETRKQRKEGGVFPAWESISTVRNQEGHVEGYVCLFSDITTIKRAADQLRYLAHHDILTGLPNRLAFTAQLDNALARARQQRGRPLALLYLDLDGFKPINDMYGHDYGDRLLKTVARRIRHSIRAEDCVARLGGDEFGIILPAICTPRDAIQAAAKIIQCIEEPVLLDSQRVAVSASIGVAIFPDDAKDGESLVRAADTAMYAAKRHRCKVLRFSAENAALPTTGTDNERE